MKVFDEFVSYIGDLETPDHNSFNIYKESRDNSCEVELRRRNLLRYLTQMYELHPTILLVGEAPGKKGCALTGIPFTSEDRILKERFFNEEYEICNVKSPTRENSASAIWKIISNKKEMPLMWNIYPFHPFENRTPNRKEVEIGMTVLNKLIDIFDIHKIYGIGRVAENRLKNHPLFVGYVRHPSYGGYSECKKQLDAILK